MKKGKVLIVDDEEDLLKLTSKWIRSAGHEVLCYTEGKGAVDFIRTHRPDLILLDIVLPEVSGVDIFKTLQADTQLHSIPVYFFTSARLGEREELGLLAVKGVIHKPYEPRELLKVINQTLEECAG